MILIGDEPLLLPRVLEVGPAPPPVDALLAADLGTAAAHHAAREVRGRAVGRAVGQQVRIRAVLLVVMMMLLLLMVVVVVVMMAVVVVAGRRTAGRLDDAVDGDERAEGRAGGAEALEVLAGLGPVGQGQGQVAHLVDLVVDLVEVAQGLLCWGLDGDTGVRLFCNGVHGKILLYQRQTSLSFMGHRQ